MNLTADQWRWRWFIQNDWLLTVRLQLVWKHRPRRWLVIELAEVQLSETHPSLPAWKPHTLYCSWGSGSPIVTLGSTLINHGLHWQKYHLHWCNREQVKHLCHSICEQDILILAKVYNIHLQQICSCHDVWNAWQLEMYFLSLNYIFSNAMTFLHMYESG